MASRKVDLPAPLGPRMAVTWPRSACPDMSLSRHGHGGAAVLPPHVSGVQEALQALLPLCPAGRHLCHHSWVGRLGCRYLRRHLSCSPGGRLALPPHGRPVLVLVLLLHFCGGFAVPILLCLFFI